MADPFNKFNSKSGFELNIDNIVSKIRLDFDTNVSNPDNYILGVNAEQNEFVLIDPSIVNNTNQVENTFDLAILGNNMLGQVNHYVFEKLVDPSVVGCSNCDATTDIKQLISSGSLPIVNKEVIAEFEVNPNAVHALEIELVGHRKICDENGNCFDGWSDQQNLVKKTLVTNTNALSDMLSTNRNAQFSFIDYSCCKCCDAYTLYQNGEITENQAKTICTNTNEFIKIDGFVVPDFYSYCTTQNQPYFDEFSTTLETISMCRLIEKTSENYGAGINSDLNSCIDSSSKIALKFPSIPVVKLTGGGCGCGTGSDGNCACCEGDRGSSNSLCCCLERTGGDIDACCKIQGSLCPVCKFSIPDCSGCEGGRCCTVDGEPTPAPTTAEPTTPAPPPATTTTTTTLPPSATTTTTTTLPPSATTSPPTTLPPTPGWTCLGPDDCVQDDTSTCFNQTECCSECDTKWVCDPMFLPIPPATHGCMQRPSSDTCDRPEYDTLQDCLDDSNACGNSWRCSINGVCEEVDGCVGNFRTREECQASGTCGRYICRSSQRTCEQCEFVPDTSVGYATLELCNSQSQCNKQSYSCNNSIVCPDGREIEGICEQVCTGGEFTSLTECVNSGCETTDFGPRWRCNNKFCEFVSPCDDTSPQQFWTRAECQESCGDFNCRTNVCTREEGSGQYPSLENCVNDCECVVYLNLQSSTTGCSECQIRCGTTKKIENGGSCIGCDSLGRNCLRCTNIFNNMLDCEIFRQNNNLIPHTCSGSRCVPTSNSEPQFENCGNYCSKTQCEEICSVPSGYNCVNNKCQPDYCGRGQYRTYDECKESCSVPLSCGYNCVPNILNPRINECKPACGAQTDEGNVSGGSSVPGEFQSLSMCKQLCLSDLGWTCKGNNCVRATIEDGPGQYETYKECVERCIIPNQAPCGVAPRILRT